MSLDLDMVVEEKMLFDQFQVRESGIVNMRITFERIYFATRFVFKYCARKKRLRIHSWAES